MQSVNSPNSWLTNFLDQRGLKQPNGNPLFSYHMTQEEYLQLGYMVKNFLPKTTFNVQKHKSWAACFVIWCSEWYRRDCSSQKWEWQPLWDRIGFELEPTQRSEMIPAGLVSFWLRPIRRYESEHRNFLGSIFIEGGLPFKLVSEPGNRFADAIRKVLKLYHQVELYGLTLNELIEKQVAFLPKVFSEQESIELMASMVRHLMSCANHVDVTNEAVLPSQQLDSKLPSWRDRFPVPLDDQTGESLLNNWLVGASHATATVKMHKDRLSCSHLFHLQTGRFSSEIGLPKTLVYHLSTASLPSSYVDLGLLEGIKRVAEFGGSIATIKEGRLQVPPRKKTVTIPRRNLYSALFVDVSQTGVTVDTLEVADSSLQLGDAPLGFIEEGGKYRLIGQGSFSTKEETIYLLMPQDYRVDVLSGTWELISNLELDGNPFQWLQVHGDIRAIFEAGQYRIKTNQTSSSSGDLYLKGDEVQYKTTPSRVYKGLPTVRTADGSLAAQQGLSLFLDNRSIESFEPYELYGRHYLSVKNKDNDTLLRRSIAILPKDLDIELKAVKGHAEIRVTSARHQTIVLQIDDAQVASEKLTDGRLFHITPHSQPPAYFQLSIRANLMDDPIFITLPYPASGIYAFDKDGNELKPNLTIEQLLGAEVNLYSAKTHAETVSVELALKPQSKGSPGHFFKVKVADKTQRVSLYSFKEKIIELMSLSKKLDAEVEMNFSGLGSNKRFTIRRYQLQLDFDELTDDFFITQDGGCAIEYATVPLAMLIAEPERAAIELPEKTVGGISIGRYCVAALTEKIGPWLIVPSPEFPSLFRPTFFKSSEFVLQEGHEIKSMQTAVKCFNPKRGEHAIADFLREMRHEFNHPSWDYFKKLWERYAYLPMATFEAWRVLVGDLSALTLALLKFEMNEDFLRALDSEFSILWELIPVKVWQRSIEAFKAYLMSLGLPEMMVQEQLVKLFEKFSNAIVNVPEGLIDILVGKPISTFPTSIQHGIIQEWKQQLIRENFESEWPDRLNPILSQDIPVIAELKQQIDFPHYRQCSVALYPVVAAAIAADKLKVKDLLELNCENIFEIKKIKSFDPSWFSSVYSCALSCYLQK